MGSRKRNRRNPLGGVTDFTFTKAIACEIARGLTSFLSEIKSYMLNKNYTKNMREKSDAFKKSLHIKFLQKNMKNSKTNTYYVFLHFQKIKDRQVVEPHTILCNKKGAYKNFLFEKSLEV